MAEAAMRTPGGGSALRRKPAQGPGTEGMFNSLRFGRRFVLIALFSYVAASMLPDALMEPVSRFTAASAAALLKLFGTQTVVEGTTILAGRFRADVIPECTSLFMVALFCSFVMAAPAPAGKKAVALLYGVPLLTTINLARIALVVETGVSFPSFFECVHVYLGQIAMIFAVFVACLVWFRSVSAVPAVDTIPAFALRFAAFSALLFLPWLQLNRWYVYFSDYLISALFSLFGYRLTISYQHEIYYQTFNLIGFAALVLASKTLAPLAKIKGMLTGFLILFTSHALIRMCNVLFTTFQMEPADRLSLVLNVTGDYLVPVILWLMMVFGSRPRLQ